MCEHKWIELHWSYNIGQKSPNPRTLKKFRTVCKKCDKTPREIELEQQLVTADEENQKLRRELSELRRGEGREI